MNTLVLLHFYCHVTCALFSSLWNWEPLLRRDNVLFTVKKQEELVEIEKHKADVTGVLRQLPQPPVMGTSKLLLFPLLSSGISMPWAIWSWEWVSLCKTGHMVQGVNVPVKEEN